MSVTELDLHNRYVLSRVTSTRARQTSQASEAAAIVRREKQAQVNATVNIIPDDVGKRIKQIINEANSVTQAAGWPVKLGNDLETLTPIEKIGEVSDMVTNAHAELQNYLAAETSDWDTFRDRCLERAGQLEVDASVFPYASAAEYMNKFNINLVVQPVPDPKALPIGLAEEVGLILGQQYSSLSYTIAYNVRATLLDAIDSAITRLGEDSKRIMPNTFNPMRRGAEMCAEIYQGQYHDIDRVTKAIPKWLDGLEYKKLPLSSAEYDATYTGTFKASLLSAHELLKSVEIVKPDVATDDPSLAL